ncbi:MAG: hypothetical protein LBM60_07780 [Clostridium sp.]|jgi:hypothetical protein|nr:hypothetical protein [Clostridium sp.]
MFEPRKEVLKLEELLLKHIENQVTRADFERDTVPATALALVELWKLGFIDGRIEKTEEEDDQIYTGSTTKQIIFLTRRGFTQVANWTHAEAAEIINRLAASGWRIPEDINPPEYVPERIKDLQRQETLQEQAE